MLPALPFETLYEDARIPTRAHPGDAGLDLYAYIPETEDDLNPGTMLPRRLHLEPGTRCLVGTGVRTAIPAGYVGLICPRSGLAAKQGITVLNAPGVVDSGYRGELLALLFNSTTGTWCHSEFHRAIAAEINHGDRIAQLLILPIATPAPFQTRILDRYATARGEGGFGSSGGYCDEATDSGHSSASGLDSR